MSAEPAAQDLLAIARRHWRRVLLLALAAGVIAVLVTWTLVPRTYKAGASLLYEAAPTPSVAGLAGFLGEEGLGLPEAIPSDPGATMSQILTSRTFAVDMVQQFGLQRRFRTRTLTDAVLEFQKRLEVNVDKGGLLALDLTLPGDPRGILSRGEDSATADLVSNIVSTMVDKLASYLRSTHYQRSRQRRAFLEEQLADTKAELRRAVEERVAFEEHSGIVSPTAQLQSVIDTLGQLDQKIALSEPTIEGLRKSVQLARRHQRPAAEIVPTESPVVQNLKTQLVSLEREYIRMREVEGMTEAHPDVAQAKRMIQATEKQLADELQEEVGSIEVSLIVEESKDAALRAERDRLQSQLRGAPQSGATHEELQRRVDLGAQTYASLYAEYVKARTEEESEAEVFNVLDPPIPPEKKSGPSTMLNALVAFFLGGFLALLWAVRLSTRRPAAPPPTDSTPAR